MSSSLGSPALVLVPTALERRALDEAGGIPAGIALVSLCGFAPIAASARTAELLATLRPARAVLIGIAGTYSASAHPVGTALAFDRVSIEGIGAGSGGGIALGFPQWDGGQRSSAVFDSLALARDREPFACEPRARESALLTVCGASASRDEAAARAKRHPTARAEDMEGFGVALACAMARTPLSIVRGLSNVAGDRDATRWKIADALRAARALALEVLGA